MKEVWSFLFEKCPMRPVRETVRMRMVRIVACMRAMHDTYPCLVDDAQGMNRGRGIHMADNTPSGVVCSG